MHSYSPIVGKFASFVAAFLVLTMWSFSTYADQRQAAEELFDLINQRLSYMEDVALYKAQHGLAVEDKEREAIVIANTAQSAEMNGIEISSAETFFAAQIEVAKYIQWRVLEVHSEQEIAEAAPRDLIEEIRPALNQLGDSMLESISDYLKHYGPVAEDQMDLFNQRVVNAYLSTEQRKDLFDALVGMQLD